MKNILLVVILSFIYTIDINAQAYSKETTAQKEERMSWYMDARFGMFIHWGAYSVLDGEYKGKKQKGALGEHIMSNLKISIEDYRKDVVGSFNPIKFEAESWAKAAHDAGMKYLVMTTKHHDGFALFDSNVSDYNIVKATPYGKDVIKELSEACKKYDLRFGIYYSQAQDWYHAGGYTPENKRWDEQQEGNWDDYCNTIVKGQVTELLTNYGDIDLIWWDSARKVPNESLANNIGADLVQIQPQVIVNSRLSPSAQKDFQTYEQVIPGVLGYEYNELCMTHNRSWSYKPSDTLWKSPEFVLETLVHMSSIGANFLFNVGPKPDGSFPHQAIETLDYIEIWMANNAESIYGTEASPFYKLHFGDATMKQEGDKTIIYFHVKDWPTGLNLTVPGLKAENVKAKALATDANIRTKQTDKGLQFYGLGESPDELISVIKLEIEGEYTIDAGYLKPRSDGAIVLKPEDALFTTKPQHDCIPEVSKINGEMTISNWRNCIPFRKKNTGNKAHWKVEVPTQRDYKVMAMISTKEEGNIFSLQGKTKLKTTLPNTGSLDSYQQVDLGILSVKKGLSTITLTGGNGKEKWDEVNIRTLRLTPLE